MPKERQHPGRPELALAIFVSLSGGTDGSLSQEQLRKYWNLAVKELDDDKWAVQHKQIVQEAGCSLEEGLSLVAFADFLDNEDSPYFPDADGLKKAAKGLGISLPQRSREDLVGWLFKRLEPQGSQHLPPDVLHKWAISYMGFPGSEKDWGQVYSKISEKYNWVAEGPTQLQFGALLADDVQQFGHLACSDDQLHGMRAEMLIADSSKVVASGAPPAELLQPRSRQQNVLQGRSRQENLGALFRLLAPTGKTVSSVALCRLSVLHGWTGGGGGAWDKEFSRMRTAHGWDENGPTEAQFAELLSAPDGSLEVSDAELITVISKWLKRKRPLQGQHVVSWRLVRKAGALFRAARDENDVLSFVQLQRLAKMLGHEHSDEEWAEESQQLAEKCGSDAAGVTEKQFVDLIIDPDGIFACDEPLLSILINEVAHDANAKPGAAEKSRQLFQRLAGTETHLDKVGMRRFIYLLGYPGEGPPAGLEEELLRLDAAADARSAGIFVTEGQFVAMTEDPSGSYFCDEQDLQGVLDRLSDSRGREEKVRDLYELLGGAEGLSSNSLRRLVNLMGFQGDAKSWAAELEKLRTERGWRDAEPTESDLAAMLADEGCSWHCDDDDVSALLMALGAGAGSGLSREQSAAAIFRALAGDRPAMKSKDLKRFADAVGYRGNEGGWKKDFSAMRLRYDWTEAGPTLAQFCALLDDMEPGAPMVVDSQVLHDALLLIQSDKAATKIQALHRGRRVRRALPARAAAPRISFLRARRASLASISTFEADDGLLSRPEAILGIFTALDRLGTSRLQSVEVYRWANICGFQGNQKDWIEEYVGLAACYGFDPSLGAQLQHFEKMLNDSEVGGGPTDEDLRGIFGDLGLSMPVLHRHDLVISMFKALDVDRGAHLGMYTLRKFAQLMAFAGSSAEWKIEFQELCKDYGFNSMMGLTTAQFFQIVNDRDGSCYCKDSDLRAMLAELDICGSRTKLRDRYAAAAQVRQKSQEASIETIVVPNPHHVLLKRMQEKHKALRDTNKREVEEQTAILADKYLHAQIAERQEALNAKAKAVHKQRSNQRKVGANAKHGGGAVDYEQRLQLLEKDMEDAAVKLQSALRGKMARDAVEQRMGFRSEGREGRRSFPTGNAKDAPSVDTSAALFLHIADKEEVKACQLLKQGRYPYINLTDVRECTALHAAAETGQMSVCRVLLGKSNFKAAGEKDYLGWNALHRAARTGQVGASMQFLGTPDLNGGDDSTLGRNGMTPLHVAALHGNADLVGKLLADTRFSQVNTQDRWGRTALHIAAEKGHTSICRSLLNCPRFDAAGVSNLWNLKASDSAEDKELRAEIKKAAPADKSDMGSTASLTELQRRCYRAVGRNDDPTKLEDLLGNTPAGVWTEWRNKGGSSLLEVCDERRRSKSATMLRLAQNNGKGPVVDGQDDLDTVNPELAVVMVFKGLHFASIAKADFRQNILNDFYRKGISDVALEEVRVIMKEGNSSKVVAIASGPPRAMRQIRHLALGKKVKVDTDTAVVQDYSVSLAQTGERKRPAEKPPSPVFRQPLPDKRPGMQSRVSGRGRIAPSASTRSLASRVSGSSPGSMRSGPSPRSPPLARSPSGSPRRRPVPPGPSSHVTAWRSPGGNAMLPSRRRQVPPGPSSHVTAWRSSRGDPTLPTGQQKSFTELQADLRGLGVEPSRIMRARSRRDLEALLADAMS